MKINDNIIQAEEGKILRRISDKQLFGQEVSLGYTYYLNGILLEEPLLELPEHYEEIDEPVTTETVLLDDETEMVEELSDDLVKEEDQQPIIRRVTIGDYLKLEEELELIKKTLGLN